jgi:hypothetical protein
MPSSTRTTSPTTTPDPMPLPAVLFGGPSPEHDISVTTGLMAARTIGACHAVYWDKTGRFHLVEEGLEPVDFADGVPRRAKDLRFVAEPGGGFTSRKRSLDISVIVLATHGGPGEDGTLQGLLDLAGYRYSGPGQAGSALGMDKLAFGAAVERLGLPSLPRLLLGDEPPPYPGPYIVKPRFGGSSIGIEVVEDHATAVSFAAGSPHHADGTVIEPFLTGSRPAGGDSVPPRCADVFDRRADPGCGRGVQLPAEVSGLGRLERGVEPARRSAGRTRRCRSPHGTVGGKDDRRSGDRPGRLPVDGRRADGQRDQHDSRFVVRSVVGAHRTRGAPARRRPELEAGTPRRYSTHGADGTALRNARSIASKLG